MSVASAGLPPAEYRAWRAEIESELRDNILQFWLTYARDPKRGGFHGLVDANLRVVADSPRGALLTCRILWTFSAAARRYGDRDQLEMARYAYRDLLEHFWDSQHGGLYWTITAQGGALDDRKQTYGQAFGIYALAEYHRVTNDPVALERGVEIYRLLERFAFDRTHGGYFDVRAADWTKPSRKLGNPLGSAPKSQNSHIHLLEAFTNLLRVWPDVGLQGRQRELIELLLMRVIDRRTHHLFLLLKDDWTPVSRAVSYGHDIELSWLLVEAADVQSDQTLRDRAVAEALEIARVVLEEGVDADGGVYDAGDARGPTSLRKDWWPQAEAVVGFLNAHCLSGDSQFLAAARDSWRFIKTRMVDRGQGDWHEAVMRDGTVLSRPRISLWKCPYHSSRACLEAMERLDVLAAGFGSKLT